MRLVWRKVGILSIGFLLGSSGSLAGGDEPPADPPPGDGAEGNAEIAALEERATKAEAERRLEDALALRVAAVARARASEADSAVLPKLLSNLAKTYLSLGRVHEALRATEECVATMRRRTPGDYPGMATGLNNLAKLLRLAGRTAEALPLLEESIAMWRRLHPGDHPGVARGLNSLAVALQTLGREAEALPVVEESLGMLRRLHPGDHPEVAAALSNLAVVVGELGRVDEALPLHEESLAMRRRLHSGDHSDVAEGLQSLGSALQALGRTGEALPLQEESLAMRRRLHPGDHPDVAASLQSLAEVLRQLGRTAEALPRFDESLQMWRRLFPGDHPRVAAGLNSLALAYAALGRAADALPLHDESLAMCRRLYPGDHPGVATGLVNLAAVLHKLGRSAEALPLCEESLAMWRRLYPGDHPSVATGLVNLTDVLRALGRSEEALPLCQESLEMQRRLFPGDHPSVAAGLDKLAGVLGALGRMADALPLFEEALGMSRRIYTADHPAKVAGLVNLAGALRALGRSAEALPLNEEALAIQQRLSPGDHPHVASSLNGLAMTLETLGRMAESLPLKEEALAMWRRIFPGDHPDVALGLNNLAYVLAVLGRATEAHVLMEESLAMQRRLTPGDHPAVAASLHSMASSLGKLGRVAEALPLHEESLAMRRRLFPGGHPEVAMSLGSAALALAALGRAAEALPLAEESLAMRRRLYPEDHPDLALALNSMGLVLERLGRTAEALSFYEQAFAMAERLGSSDAWRWGTNLGGVLVDGGRAAEALGPLRAAVEGVEEQRSSARGLTPEERARFVGTLRQWGDPYALLVRAHVALSQPEAALEMLERGRGREMLDLLHGAGADPVARATERARAGGDERAQAALQQARERSLAAEAEVLRRTNETERARARSGVRPAERRALMKAESTARKGLLRARAALRRLVADVLPEAKPLAAQELRALLAGSERVLAYSLGASHGHAFLVGPEGVEVHALEVDGSPVTGAHVADAVRRHREALLDAGAGDDADVLVTGAELFGLLFPPGVREQIAGARRLYVVPAGPLEAIPFETLVVGEERGRPVYWAQAGPPIAYEPSGSVLGWLRSQPARRGTGPALVAVGDPLFSGQGPALAWPQKGILLTEVRADGQAKGLGLRRGDVLLAYDGKPVSDAAALRDAMAAAGNVRSEIPVAVWREGERIEVRMAPGPLGVMIAQEAPDRAGPKLVEGGAVAALHRSATERAARLAPLPGTRVEVEAIQRAFRKHQGAEAQVRVLLGAAAREAALFEAAQGARRLHLATHGIVDEAEMASFSALALTMPAIPVVGDDGFLTLLDLFGRWHGRLEGTDLVVLSACDSARGKALRDEGAYALPWGFLFAGARAVVASQWKVDDEATSYLMAEFYRRMLEGDGQEALDALAAARLATRERYPHPRYWGAFVFAGAAR